VPKKELDLFEFATGEMTEPGACATEVVRSELVYASRLSGLLHDFPDHFRCHAVAPDLVSSPWLYCCLQIWDDFLNSNPKPNAVLPATTARSTTYLIAAVALTLSAPRPHIGV
jgi:hypothetical protein